MSTTPSEQPRLPDSEKEPQADIPDLDRAHQGRNRSRIPEGDEQERIPDPEE